MPIVPSLVQGRIVRATVPDPQGQNPKNRRCVVISDNQAITPGGRVVIVGITTELTQSPAAHYVPLQHGAKCWTGLTDPSAALCTWTVELPVAAVDVQPNFVRPEHVLAILHTVKELIDQGHQFPRFSL